MHHHALGWHAPTHTWAPHTLLPACLLAHQLTRQPASSPACLPACSTCVSSLSDCFPPCAPARLAAIAGAGQPAKLWQQRRQSQLWQQRRQRAVQQRVLRADARAPATQVRAQRQGEGSALPPCVRGVCVYSCVQDAAYAVLSRAICSATSCSAMSWFCVWVPVEEELGVLVHRCTSAFLGRSWMRRPS